MQSSISFPLHWTDIVMPNVDCGYYASTHDSSESSLNKLSCTHPLILNNYYYGIITLIFIRCQMHWHYFDRKWSVSRAVMRAHMQFYSVQLSRQSCEAAISSKQYCDGNVRFRICQIDKQRLEPPTTTKKYWMISPERSFGRSNAAKKTQFTHVASHNYYSNSHLFFCVAFSVRGKNAIHFYLLFTWLVLET